MQIYFNVHMLVSFLNRLENGVFVTMEIEPHGGDDGHGVSIYTNLF